MGRQNTPFSSEAILINITHIYKNTKNKAGKKYMSKDKPFFVMSIEDSNGVKYSRCSFDPIDPDRGWQIGDQKEIFYREGLNGYYDYMPKDKPTVQDETMNKLYTEVKEVNKNLKVLTATLVEAVTRIIEANETSPFIGLDDEPIPTQTPKPTVAPKTELEKVQDECPLGEETESFM